MNLKKFAAHYMLSPDGCFLKWPVITVRDDGQIMDVQTSPEGLKEQPGTSFFSGILVPAFIDIWLIDPPAFPDNRFFNRHFSQGTLIMRKPEGFDETEDRKTFPLLCSSLPKHPDEATFGGNTPLWERIKNHATSNLDIPFQQILHQVTTEAARFAGISNAGRLEPDASPGLLLVRKADLTGPSLTPDAVVNWLNVPSSALFESLTRKTK
ncbi:MAG: hypothetical protein ACOCPW_05735 [Marinilabiliaceae bacterium]